MFFNRKYIQNNVLFYCCPKIFKSPPAYRRKRLDLDLQIDLKSKYKHKDNNNIELTIWESKI